MCIICWWCRTYSTCVFCLPLPLSVFVLLALSFDVCDCALYIRSPPTPGLSRYPLSLSSVHLLVTVCALSALFWPPFPYSLSVAFCILSCILSCRFMCFRSIAVVISRLSLVSSSPFTVCCYSRRLAPPFLSSAAFFIQLESNLFTVFDTRFYVDRAVYVSFSLFLLVCPLALFSSKLVVVLELMHSKVN